MKKNSAPSLQPHEPIRAGLPRIAVLLVEHALALFEPSMETRRESIHEIRLTIKRLRALLLLVRPMVSASFFEREKARLRKAARGLAPSRDFAIARETLRTLAKCARGRHDRDAFARALHGLGRTSGEAADLRSVGAALRLHARNVQRLQMHVEGWPIIAPGLKAIYRAGRRRMKRALASDDDAAFHRWRIRAKALCYVLEMLAPVCSRRLCHTRARLEKLQSKLGDDHDLIVLKSLLKGAPESFGGACAIQRVIAYIDQRSRKLRKSSEKVGRAIYREKPRRFCERVTCRAGGAARRKPKGRC
jgi:CHAD domain-containing protein